MSSPLLEYPFDVPTLLRKRRSLRSELSERAGAEVRVALLGGSTTDLVKDFLELFLLDAGLQPVFYQSQYGKYEEDVLVDDSELRAFQPQVAVVHTTWHNARFPDPLASEEQVAAQLEGEVGRFRAIWDHLIDALDCTVVQNNFDVPMHRALGGLDATLSGGRARFLTRLNEAFADASARRSRLLINDIAHLAAVVGLERWSDAGYWYKAKLAVSPPATVQLAHNLAAVIRGMFGRTRKVLVLDLDNTVWGGVIGDDGLEGLHLGHETPRGEAHVAFQRYCLELKRRGVLLAVCSKNEPSIARDGFTHPDMVLGLDDLVGFKASWEPKHEAIAQLARELSLGLDSFVFVDDNPAERAIVRGQLPMVAVPEVGDDPSRYIELLDRQLYFEVPGISAEDFERSKYYSANAQRNVAQTSFADYGEFLDSLQMKAEVAPFHPTYMQRIVQLTNKTNQFNLTTRRYSAGEMEAMRTDDDCIALYGRLADRFGDNGLVSIVVGRIRGDELDLDLWLMSCRVLKRDLELLMLDEVVRRADERGVRTITGTYLPTARNMLVRDHYERLGFELVERSDDGSAIWRLSIDDSYEPRNAHIREVIRG